MRGKCPALEHITIIEKSIRGGGEGELTATSDLATFSVFYDRPSKNICQSLENCSELACSKFYGSCAELFQPSKSLIYFPTVQRC